MVFRRLFFVFLGMLAAAFLSMVTGCADRDSTDFKKNSSGSNAAIAVDPYIVGALFEEVAADGQAVLQANSTRSDSQGRFYFPDEISVGSVIKLQASARGVHGGMPYTGILLRRVDPGQKGPFVVSPLTTILANKVTPDELITLLDNSGLPGLQRDGLFRDPMQGLVAAGGKIDQQALQLLQANLAAGVYLIFLEIPKFIDQVNPYETNFPYFADAVSLVQDTLDGQLLSQFLAEVSPDFSLDDRLATSIRLCQLTVSEFERALAAGQAVSGGLLADIVAGTIAVALDVAKEVYFARTGEKMNLLPIAITDTVSAVEGGTTVTGNVLTNDDPGDAPATVSSADQGGTAISLGSAFTTTGGGSLTVNSDGTYSYTPPILGTVTPVGLVETINYTVTDQDGDAASARLTIQVENTNLLSSAVDDTVSAVEGGTAVTGNVLTNDDPGDAPATVSSADQGGTAISLGSAFTTTGGGSLTVNSDGTYSYTPPSRDVPPVGLMESFRYFIEDEDGDASSAMLIVNISYNGQPYSISVFSPVRIALAPTGQLLVSSSNSGNIPIFNPDSTQREGAIQANRKMSAIGAASNRVFVGLDVPGAVGCYTYDGQLLYLLGSGIGEFGTANDLVIVSDQVYVTDSRNKQVRVYNLADGAFLRSFGQDRMHFPTGIAIDPNSNTLLVSDFGVGTEGGGMMSPGTYYAGIWRYDLNGNYVETISGDFSRPQGLAVNANGEIFLADSLRGEVLVLRKKPDAPGYLEPYSYGTGDIPLRLPLDVAIDPLTQTLYVTNNLLNRVEVIPEGGLLP
ncbi:MAG: hypothetical protein K0A93_10860 [Desulfuromonadaceae bacterium]|nr:hypothetical protein [Desulfuromonadaceae bacterium]